MPNTIIHLTAAEDLVARCSRGRVGQALEACPWAARLGSVFVDLPFFGCFALKTGLYLLSRPLPHAEWGQVFHYHRPGTLATQFLRGAWTEARYCDEAWPTAFVAGLLSHLALDRVVHPHVEAVVRRRESGPPEVIHDRCETAQNLFFQREERGWAGVGEPRLWALYRFGPLLRPWGPGDDFLRFVRGATIRAYGRSPSRLALGSWVRGMQSYGWLMGSPLGRTQDLPRRAQDRERLRALYYDDGQVAFPALYRQAMERAEAYGEALEGWLGKKNDVEGFLAAVTDDDLGP